MHIHKYATPKVKELKIDVMTNFQEDKEAQKEKDVQQFFNSVFLNWTRLLSEQSLRTHMGHDTQIWDLKIDKQLENQSQHSQASQLAGVKSELAMHAEILFTVFRHLQSRSEAYPFLDFRQTLTFLKGVGFIDELYTILPLMAVYEKIKAPEKKQKTIRKSFLKKRHTNPIINYPGLKKKKDEELKDPTNLLHRFHFMELIAKISIEKYDRTPPHESLRRFISDHIMPNLKSKALLGCRLSQEVLSQKFFNNAKVCKLLFLNQFELKRIYDMIVERAPPDPLAP